MRTLPTIKHLSQTVPDFDSSGQLPIGDYAPSEDEFKRHFVSINNKGKREDIYTGWKRHGQALQKAGLQRDSRQLLNGSYTSNKEYPGDIDIAVEVRITGDFTTFCKNNTKLFNLLSGPKATPQYNCDAYPIPIVPESNPNYKTITEDVIEYWTKWFGKDRRNQKKGRIWAFTGEHP